MDDPRTTIIKDLDLSSCRVVRSESPIVLLCGGKVPLKERADDPDPPNASLRHALTRSNTAYELFRPEEITSWQADGVFNNLVDFENDLASICTLVVIVLESAGAIAELGAFSQLPDLRKKILAIKSKSFDDDSFINLGILRHIAEAKRSSVRTYPWSVDTPGTITTEVIDDATNDIKDELSRLQKTEVFRLNDRAHTVALIWNLIRLFVALKESEILKYLAELGLAFTRHELRRILFLLQEFKLIHREEYSDSVFYLEGRDKHHHLRTSFQSTTQSRDDLRIRMECTNYYKISTKEKHRLRVIQRLVGGNT